VALEGEAKPWPKSSQFARGPRRYRRKVASPKGWQAIADAKMGPCRVCGLAPAYQTISTVIQLHHLVWREDHGDDVADNIVPICRACHASVHRRAAVPCGLLLKGLSDAEYAYMVTRGGEDYPERVYGLRYDR
jgi:hypothetical protein